MSLPALIGWENTRAALHQAAQVVGAVRAAVAPPESNWTHLGLRVVPRGLTSGVLSAVGELLLDFVTPAIVYDPPGQKPVTFALGQRTQQSLADAVEQGLATSGHPVALKRGKITAKAPFAFDPRLAADYAQVLYALAETFRVFRDELPSQKSPLVVWPHGFDLSFLWFATAEASEQAPHVAFGFSPSSPGLDRPYLYSYVYPLPEGLTDRDLPPYTHWHTEGWTGTVTPYDDLAGRDDAAAVVADTLRALYASLSPVVGQ
jgi:hypothetical protein